MKQHRKIDLYFCGDYYLSTNQSKTCREAVQTCLQLINDKGENYRTVIEKRIKASPESLKARFSK